MPRRTRALRTDFGHCELNQRAQRCLSSFKLRVKKPGVSCARTIAPDSSGLFIWWRGLRDACLGACLSRVSTPHWHHGSREVSLKSLTLKPGEE